MVDNLRHSHRRATLLLTGTMLLGASPAFAIEVTCGQFEGDGFGWSVASGRDFDGDSVPDIAVGAPCATVGSASQAGRVRVFSGLTGRRILSLSGSATNQRFGGAIAFVEDLDGDGRAELAIGTPNAVATSEGGGSLANAGRLQLRSSKGNVLWTVFGPNAEARLGETVDSLSDINGDGKAEIVVGASEASEGQGRRGIAFLLSGASGAELARSVGVRNFDFWGSVVAAPGDIDGDGTDDWIVASNAADRDPNSAPPVFAAEETTTTTTTTTTSSSTTSTTLVQDVGRVSFLSGQAGYPELAELEGSRTSERFGRSVAGLPDQDDDGVRDVAVGAPGFVSSGFEVGRVSVFTGLGGLVRHLLEPALQEFAGFGTAVTALVSDPSDPEGDIVASAPLARVSGLSQAGRVHAFSSAGGAHLWTSAGDVASARFGQSLASGLDYDSDGVGDVVVGAPGDAHKGRRGAGVAYILSGADGSRLAAFGGRRGRESRLFVAGPGSGREATLRSFDPFGRRREAEIVPFRGQRSTGLSMAVLDEGGGANGNRVLVAIGSGRGGSSSNVRVYRTGRRRSRVADFPGAPTGYDGGLHVAAGDFSAEAGEEVVAAPADDAGAVTSVAFHRRTFTDPDGISFWSRIREFAVFSQNDTIEGQLVDPDGVFVAAGNLTAADRDEVVVAPVAGLPAFRVLSNSGTKISERLAYPPQSGSTSNSGLSVAIGDFDGNGTREIVTAPHSGQFWVKVWQANGQPWEYDDDANLEASFFVTQYGALFRGGLRLATADVDFDGRSEIIVGPGPGVSAEILAFEPDGNLVEGWLRYAPFGPLARNGILLLGTDEFWRP